MGEESSPQRQRRNLDTDFFHSQTPPLNLAVFRIVICAALLFYAPRSADYLTLPDIWLQVPLGSELVFWLIPRSEVWSNVLWWAFAAHACVGSSAGTRVQRSQVLRRRGSSSTDCRSSLERSTIAII